MSCSRADHLVPQRLDQRPGDATRGTGVTSPTQWLDSRGVSTGTGTMSRRGSPATAAYRCIISR